MKKLLNIKKHSGILLLILLSAISILLLMSEIDFQSALAQGDHGRDLYAFRKTLEGKLPYKDYWWVYGPLMPFYYGSFINIFGNSRNG